MTAAAMPAALGRVGGTGRRLLLLAAADIVLTIGADRLALNPAALARLPVLQGWSADARVAGVMALHVGAALVFLVAKVVVLAVTLQFILLLFGVEVRLPRLIGVTTAATWIVLLEAGVRAMLIAAGFDAALGASGSLVPGSVAFFIARSAGSLTPVQALLNYLNPFEAAWVAVVAFRLAWIRVRGLSPALMAALLWLATVLPPWMLAVGLATLIRK